MARHHLRAGLVRHGRGEQATGPVDLLLRDALGRTVHAHRATLAPSVASVLELPALALGTYQLIIRNEERSQVVELLHMTAQ